MTAPGKWESKSRHFNCSISFLENFLRYRKLKKKKKEIYKSLYSTWTSVKQCHTVCPKNIVLGSYRREVYRQTAVMFIIFVGRYQTSVIDTVLKIKHQPYQLRKTGAQQHQPQYVTSIWEKCTRCTLTLQRGVTGTARMLHSLTHSSISRQVREQM